jgi:anti-sigma factor RsiW
MKDLDQKLKEQFKSEADKHMFDNIEFDDRLKNKVRQQADSSRRRRGGIMERLAAGRRKWAYGAAAVAMAVMLIVLIPILQSPDPISLPAETPAISPVPSVSPGGTVIPDAGSSLTSLITVNVQTPEEAKERFGPDLLVPTYVPEGFKQTEIQTVGMEEDVATRVHFFYSSGDQTLTVTEERGEADLNFDLFESVQVNGVAGYVFAQPGITELYWLADGIQFSVVGPITEAEAMKVAESFVA